MFINDIDNIIHRLCYEFQSVWIINAKTQAMRIYTSDSNSAIPGSIEKVTALGNYSAAKEWYINNCVATQDQPRLLKQTEINFILEKISDGRPYALEYTRICNSISNYNQLYFAKYEPDDEPLSHFILGFRDIDVRKKAERDDLTGVYTRQCFFQKANELLAEYPDDQFDLMISDIVDFKAINDSYGLSTGDDILSWFGTFLAQRITDDIIVGRYGGDQFVLMCKHKFMQLATDADQRDFLSKTAIEQGLPKTVVKFGVYENVDHSKPIISTCDKAHQALNSIKHRYGIHIAYYDDSIRNRLEIERKIENSMHKAIEDEQFKVFYQPKHDALTGKLIGAEALIRWIHPEYGFMSPSEFIPIFERNGFITEADFYVWKKTCENLRKWIDKGIKTVAISVNSSKLSFQQDNLLSRLHSETLKNALRPEMLHLEITETLMTEDSEELINKLTQIREAGYQIELDDFGAGYSSINVLSTLPLDVVKLDMSFMKQFGNEKRKKVLSACINLAKELGYKTVSEGVEQKEQCDILAILGVDAIQGYYYSKPLPEDEFEQYMLNN